MKDFQKNEEQPIVAPSRKLRIGITHGDPNGIGYEVIFKAFSEPMMLDLCTPIIYGSTKMAHHHHHAISAKVNFHPITVATEAKSEQLNVLHCVPEDIKVEFGQATSEAGRAAFLALERAVSDYKAGLIDAIVTAPINKNAIQSEDFDFKGHTEYFAHRFGSQTSPLMLLCSNNLRVALATTHLPVREVASHLSIELLQEKLQTLHQSLLQDFLIPSPRIAVLSLNPHCGDNGLLGAEEKDIIEPAISQAQHMGIPCYGPYAADGFFGKGLYRHFDAILAMYHDQGLAPFKALADGDGVNFTAGLNYVRTSPDHGTAFDIAGQGQADESSMRHAIYMALDVVRNRTFDTASRSNPLPKLYHEHREDQGRARRFPSAPYQVHDTAPQKTQKEV